MAAPAPEDLRLDRLLRRQSAGRRSSRPTRRPPAALDDEPLGVRLARALQAEGERATRRRCAASAITRCSWSASSPTASRIALVDVDYYISLGGSAYGRLASRTTTRSRTSSGRWPRSSCRSWTCSPTSATARRSAPIATCCGSTTAGCGPAVRATVTCLSEMGILPTLGCANPTTIGRRNPYTVLHDRAVGNPCYNPRLRFGWRIPPRLLGRSASPVTVLCS